MKKLTFILLSILLFACNSKEIIIIEESLIKYEGWVVIEKCPVIINDNYNIDYSIIIENCDNYNQIKKIYTYEYYYKKFELGDTIQFHNWIKCKTISDTLVDIDLENYKKFYRIKIKANTK